MKIAFYAPLKSPRHVHPSGDRRLARLFMDALQRAGWAVELASELRAWEGQGDPHRQAEIQAHGLAEAERLIAEYRSREAAARPRCWFTYHLYHKAPDWIGSAVSAALDIPFVVAEASVARRQRHGPWRCGYQCALAAVRQARLIFNLNSNDLAGLRPFVRHPDALVELKPFTEIAPPAPPVHKPRLRGDLARRWRLDADKYWLLCVAMMRRDSKSESYRILADAMAALASRRADWQLVVVGDGPAEQSVRALFDCCSAGAGSGSESERVRFLGRLDTAAIHLLMRASDLFVWPACNEAFGMAALEALGCGLPVVAGRSHGGGIGDIVAHGVSGLLLANPDGRQMAVEIEKLLDAPDTLARMSAAASAAFDKFHRLDNASARIGAALAAVVG